MERIFYLDNAATTKMFDDVKEKSSKFLNVDFYNPSAVYKQSVDVRREVENSRNKLLDFLGGLSDDKLIFTGSATEANNMVIFSQRNFAGKKYLFGAGEHPSVKECAKELEKRGYNVLFVPLDKSGRIDEEKYKQMLDSNVVFVSVQHVSNETGAVNNIKRLVSLAKKANPNVKFHSDGVQAFMKFPIDVQDLGVDYYTISAHKIGGAKGVGALYVKKGSKISPVVFGGGQEDGLRSGTENVFGIVSFALAAEKMNADMKQNFEKVSKMREELLSELSKVGVNYVVHGESGVPHTMNIMLEKSIRGETLVHALERRGILLSTGSACSATKHLNSTLEAMGVPNSEILASERISIGAYMDFDAKLIAKIIREEIDKLKG